MKKAIVFLCLILILTINAFAVEEPEITSDYAIVYNIETGKTLYEKGINSIIYPASLTKIMTGLLACEYYEKQGDFNVTVTETALEAVEGSNVKLKAGETVSFYDLIVAMAVGGGNDAAYVIAEAVGGSVDTFIEMMNERARNIGATHTSYSNPSGFHSSYMLTTLSDQALICTEASKNELLLEITSLIEYDMPETNLSKKRHFTYQNLLFDPDHWLRHYTPDTKGFNAGMTPQAGWCMATVYKNDGLTDIVIVSGGSVENYTYHYINDVKSLIDYAKKGYAFTKVLDKGEVLHDIEVKLGDEKDRLILTSADEITALLPVGVNVKTDITVKSEPVKNVCEAPVKEGDTFGTVKVYYGEEFLGEVNLVALTGIKRSFKLLILDRIGKAISNMYVKAILIFLSSLAFAYLVFLYIRSAIRKRRERIAHHRARMQNMSHARKTLRN